MSKKKVVVSSVYFLVPLLVLFCLEALKRNGFDAFFTWAIEYPARLIVTYLIILLIQTVFFIFSKNVYIVCLITIAFFMIWFVIDTNKMDILNNPLLPWDLFFVKQLVNLFPVIYKELNILVLIGSILVFIALIVLLAKKANTVTFNLKLRVPLVLVAIVLIIMVGFSNNNFVGKIFEANNIAVLDWDQNLNQELNGTVLGFMLNMHSVLIDKPEHYSEESITNIKVAINKNSEPLELEHIKPNIIMIMSEAFWDIGKINQRLADEDYIPNVHKYQVGNLASPQFGGGTANVEFEALTGISMNLLPAGSIPYQQYIKKATPSIASFLLQEGYSTTAIHTYFKWFWDRENVYKHLGFEKFISVSEMPDAQNHGYYIGDDEISRQILNEVEENKDPVFIYAVTMQNHGSYNDDRYGEETIQVPGEYEEDTQNSFNTYVTGLVDADRELEKLVRYFEQSEEPTILVFYGDHLPLMGSNYKSYIETGFIESEENWSLQDKLKMKETPLVIWNNFDEEVEQLDSISPAFLASKVLKLANFNQPELFQFLDGFSESLPVYTNTVIQDSNKKLYNSTPNEYLEMENTYKQLQYDILFGNQYLYK